jgi:2-amino-4-hydroxy-6-hydroxymethyldihydropteridine diphosphokinase
MTAAELYERLKEIERTLGRTPTMRWGPREIDLDLLYFGDTIVHTDRFMIPHRETSNRRFVLVPLSEIAGDFVDPAHGKSIDGLLHQCPDHGAVKRCAWSLVQTPVEE